ncbi:down syndrome cell adhesion molecule homolog [Trichonephila clavipes]|nr:down syndrome cell adhesion molecule homolog [Trichonephila clavipes]
MLTRSTMATSSISTSTILPWDWRGGKYSPVPCTHDSAHKAFGPTDFTSTFSVCTRRAFGSIRKRNPGLLFRIPPRWILEPRDTSAIAGRSAKIDCQADGVPQPHVRWKMSLNSQVQEFKTIVSSSHVHILVNGSLNFRSVETADEGSYLCEANNGVGAGLSTVVRLTVHSAPKFDSKFTILSSRRGERMILACNSYGDIPMTFTWRKNGIVIDPVIKPRYSQQSENLRGGEGTKLVIEKAEREDSASFTCTAMNDFGEDSMNFQLTVQDVPDAPQNLEIHDVGSRSVRLTWNRPFDGNSPIKRYTTSWRRIDDQSVGGPLTVPGDETTIIIRGLKPKTRYFFRVKCENALGDSQYGAEVAVTTLEEPPREAPSSVKAVPLSSRSVNVTWQRPLRNDASSSVDGFYVGIKSKGSLEPYTFKSVVLMEGLVQHFEIRNLNRFTEYTIVVQPFNSRGAGPPSEEIESCGRPGLSGMKLCLMFFPFGMMTQRTAPWENWHLERVFELLRTFGLVRWGLGESGHVEGTGEKLSFASQAAR